MTGPCPLAGLVVQKAESMVFTTDPERRDPHAVVPGIGHGIIDGIEAGLIRREIEVRGA
jgi:hypothetical protein